MTQTKQVLDLMDYREQETASIITNSLWSNSFNWDGSINIRISKAFEPITNPKEMNNTWQNVENTLNGNEQYRQLFMDKI